MRWSIAMLLVGMCGACTSSTNHTAPSPPAVKEPTPMTKPANVPVDQTIELAEGSSATLPGGLTIQFKGTGLREHQSKTPGRSSPASSLAMFSLAVSDATTAQEVTISHSAGGMVSTPSAEFGGYVITYLDRTYVGERCHLKLRVQTK
jgi:hypothetical protein